MSRAPRSLFPEQPGGAHRGRAHPAILVVGAAAIVVLVLVATGVVRMPDLVGALERLSHTLGPWTYALVAGMAFLETGAFVGLVAPGETALILGGVVAAQGDVSLPLILAVAWPAAALGDLASYALGGRLGRPFLLRRGPALGVTHARLRTLDGFLDRHGGKTILIGRFIGLVRAVAPFAAGAAGLPLRRLLPWSLLGTAAWTSSLTLTGYLFGSSVSAAAGVLTHTALALAVLAALVVTVRGVRRRRRLPAPA
jgi:membrane protein DedA with SNARE-associated domain